MASGKSTVVEALKKDGFRHTTLSDIVREETARRGLPAERTTFQNVGQSLREEFGAGILGKKALEKLLQEGGDKWIVDGIRNPAEVLELKRHKDFILIANTAPEDLIVSRILSRKRPDDTLDEEVIRTKLRREMGEGESPEGQQVQKCIDMADYTFENTMPIEEVEAEFMKLYTEINEKQKIRQT
jgi:dephospho-CoA kinase